MTFATRVAQRDLACFFYARITGLPYIFATGPIPSAWDAGGGTVSYSSETYTWSETLLLDSLGDIGQSVEPKRGTGITGSLSLDFRITGTQQSATSDVWLSLANYSLHRTDKTYSTLTADITTGETTSATASTSTGWASSGYIYVNNETIQYGSHSGGTFSTLTRGRFGSWARHHIGGVESIREVGYGGAHIASGPLVLEGRVVELWLATGTWDDATFTPYGGNTFSTEDRQIFAGVVRGVAVDDDLTTVTIDAQSQDTWLAQEVGSRLPRAKAGILNPEMIQIDDSNNVITWSLNTLDNTGDTHHKPTSYRLTRDNGAGGSEVVPDGVYHVGTVGTYINHTINNATYDNSISGFGLTFTLYTELEDNRPKVSLRIDATTIPGDLGNFWYHNAVPSAGINASETLWAELGFQRGGNILLNAAGTYVITADKFCSIFRWPANNYNSRRLYYTEATGPAFTESPGWTNDDGTALNGFVKIGDSEIVEFNAKGTATTNTAQNFDYITVLDRRQFGSYLEEDIYIEYDPNDDKRPELTQIMGFEDTSFARALLYMMLGFEGGGDNDATYDKGWRGAGAMVPAQFVDIASFTKFHQERGAARRMNLAVCEATELRDIIKDHLVAFQAYMGATNASGTHKITLLQVEPPAEDEVDGASIRTISHSNVNSREGVQYDTDVGRLVNVVHIKANWDYAKKKAWDTFEIRNGTSIGTYNEQDALKLTLPGLPKLGPRAVGPVQYAVDRVTHAIWSAYAWPYAVVRFQVTDLAAWTWEIGDAAVISHDALPALNSVGRGWESVLGRIYKIVKHYRRDGVRATVTAVVRRIQSKRFGTWSPSAYLASKSSDTSWTATANKYSDSSDGNDLDHLDAGDVVRWVVPGTTTTGTATVATASGTAITFDGAGITQAAPVIITAIEYNDANITATQKKHAFIGSDDPPPSLDVNGGTTDVAFYLY